MCTEDKEAQPWASLSTVSHLKTSLFQASSPHLGVSQPVLEGAAQVALHAAGLDGGSARVCQPLPVLGHLPW